MKEEGGRQKAEAVPSRRGEDRQRRAVPYEPPRLVRVGSLGEVLGKTGAGFDLSEGPVQQGQKP